MSTWSLDDVDRGIDVMVRFRRLQRLRRAGWWCIAAVGIGVLAYLTL
jgi:hypothetical protein